MDILIKILYALVLVLYTLLLLKYLVTKYLLIPKAIKDLDIIGDYVLDTEYLFDLIGTLNKDQNDYSEKEVNLWRTFCNDLASTDKFFMPGVLYIILDEHELLNKIPDFVKNNFKFSDSVVTIRDRITEADMKIVNASDNAERVLRLCKESLADELMSAMSSD